MVARNRSAAVSPIEVARAASSAIRASAEAAIPRGVPVEPEVSLTKPAVGNPRSARVLGCAASVELGTVARAQSSGPAGQPAGQRSRAGAPRARRMRQASASGVRASSSRTARPARRRASSEARKPGPLAAARPTGVPGARVSPARTAPAARDRASTSATVLRRRGEITRGASGSRRTIRSNAWRMGSGCVMGGRIILEDAPPRVPLTA